MYLHEHLFLKRLAATDWPLWAFVSFETIRDADIAKDPCQWRFSVITNQ
jgi:hypothetical protein